MSPARVRILLRFGETKSELSPYVILSLLAHAGFVVVLLFLPSLTPSKPLPDNPLVVDLVAAPSRARAEARTAPTTPPPQAESTPPDVARIETRTPPPAKPLPEKIEPAPRPRKLSDPEPPPPRRTASGEATETPDATDATQEIHGDAGANSISPLEGGDVEFAWYRSAVTAALYGRWRRPLLDRLVETIEVRVSFEIQRNGSVQGLRVEQSSGVPTLDRSAVRAVSEADPLPPLPPNWRDSVLPATFLFRLHPE